MIIATAESNRQVKALAHHVRDKLKEAGATIVGVEGEETGEWVLVDAGDIVVHIMQPAVRAYYNLEELWAPRQAARARAKASRPRRGVAAATGIPRRGAIRDEAPRRRARPPDAGVGRRRLGRLRAADAARIRARARRAEARAARSRQAGAAAARRRGERIAAACKDARVVALDERGRAWTTRELADRLARWRDEARDVAFVIGSADGLADSVKRDAAAVVALSALTLPHGLVRVMRRRAALSGRQPARRPSVSSRLRRRSRCDRP